MAKSKIVIVFNDPMNVGELISFDYRDLTKVSPSYITCSTDFVSVKYSKGQAEVTNPTGNTGTFSALDYMDAFQVDYNVPPVFKVTKSGYTITIEALNDGIEFSSESISVVANTITITNEAYTPPYSIESVEFLAAASQCNNVKVKVTTSENTTSVTSPVNLTPNDTEFEFDNLRGNTFSLEISNGITNLTQSVNTPSVLESPVVEIINKPSGATVLLSNDNNLDLTLEYSLDGTNYQGLSIFQTILPNTYTAYVRDEFGCVKTASFTVDAFTPQIEVLDPVIYISNANSFRFKKNEVWDYKTIYKTDKNTLSFEEDNPLRNAVVYPYIQKFQTIDSIRTQILCNYENIEVKVHDKTNEYPIIVEKMSNNIDLKDKRDARIFEMEDGKTGMYFIAGNIYNYDTDVVEDNYYANSPYPEWAVIGRSVYIDEISDYLILENIVFDTEKQKDVLVFSAGYQGAEKDTIVSVIYNLFPFEVYEFTVSMSTYQDKCIQISIDITDSVFEDMSFSSELISVKEIHPRTLEVVYYNSTNNDIVYTTGITHLLRLDYSSFKLATESEREVHKTDTNVIPISDDIYPKKELNLIGLSTMMAQKVVEAFGQDFLMINRDLYTKESLDTPSKRGSTNLYDLKAALYKTKEQVEIEYNSTGIIIPEIGQSPDLISTGSGFLAYK